VTGVLFPGRSLRPVGAEPALYQLAVSPSDQSKKWSVGIGGSFFSLPISIIYRWRSFHPLPRLIFKPAAGKVHAELLHPAIGRAVQGNRFQFAAQFIYETPISIIAGR
jgi:hypothetical protein